MAFEWFFTFVKTFVINETKQLQQNLLPIYFKSFTKSSDNMYSLIFSIKSEKISSIFTLVTSYPTKSKVQPPFVSDIQLLKNNHSIKRNSLTNYYSIVAIKLYSIISTFSMVQMASDLNLFIVFNILYW